MGMLASAVVVTNLVLWLLVTPPLVLVTGSRTGKNYDCPVGNYSVVVWIAGMFLLRLLSKKYFVGSENRSDWRLFVGKTVVLWNTLGLYLISLIYVVSSMFRDDPQEKKVVAGFGIGTLAIAWVFTLQITNVFVSKSTISEKSAPPSPPPVKPTPHLDT